MAPVSSAVLESLTMMYNVQLWLRIELWEESAPSARAVRQKCHRAFEGWLGARRADATRYSKAAEAARTTPPRRAVIGKATSGLLRGTATAGESDARRRMSPVRRPSPRAHSFRRPRTSRASPRR